MRTSLPGAGLAGALTIAALVLAACGGTTSSAAPSGAASPAPSEAPASAPISAAPSEAAASPEASSPIAIPSFDVSDLVANLENVDSYRLTITTNGEVGYRATVVTKPVLARDVSLGDQRFVIIGDEMWMGSAGSDDLVPAPAEMATGLLGAFDPAVLVGAFAAPGAMTGATDVGIEEKNGVQARHFRVDADSLVGTMASMPPGSSVDIWIAEDAGILVSLAVAGSAEGDFSMDVTNIDDPANVVERPS